MLSKDLQDLRILASEKRETDLLDCVGELTDTQVKNTDYLERHVECSQKKGRAGPVARPV